MKEKRKTKVDEWETMKRETKWRGRKPMNPNLIRRPMQTSLRMYVLCVRLRWRQVPMNLENKLWSLRPRVGVPEGCLLLTAAVTSGVSEDGLLVVESSVLPPCGLHGLILLSNQCELHQGECGSADPSLSKQPSHLWASSSTMMSPGMSPFALRMWCPTLMMRLFNIDYL